MNTIHDSVTGGMKYNTGALLMVLSRPIGEYLFLMDEGKQSSKESTLNHSLHLPSGMQIFVTTETGKTIILDVMPLDTIKNVKFKIHKKMGFPLDHQQLFFNGKELDKYELGHSLSDYYIQQESMLQLKLHVPVGMQIFVEISVDSGMDNKFLKIITLDVDPLDTFKDIKDKILEKEGHPLEQQRLFIRTVEGIDSWSAILDDSHTLSYYNIQHKSFLLNLLKPLPDMQILVMVETGEIITLDVDKWYTINRVKSKIEEKVGLPLNQQHLFFNGTQLEEGNILSDYNIQQKSMLHLSEYNQTELGQMNETVTVL